MELKAQAFEIAEETTTTGFIDAIDSSRI